MKKYILPALFFATFAAQEAAHREEVSQLHDYYFKKVHLAYIVGQVHFLDDFTVLRWNEDTVYFDPVRLDQDLFPFHPDAVHLDFGDVRKQADFYLFE